MMDGFTLDAFRNSVRCYVGDERVANDVIKESLSLPSFAALWVIELLIFGVDPSIVVRMAGVLARAHAIVPGAGIERVRIVGRTVATGRLSEVDFATLHVLGMPLPHDMMGLITDEALLRELERLPVVGITDAN